MSIADLDERIALLKTEVARLEEAKRAKQTALAAAGSVFSDGLIVSKRIKRARSGHASIADDKPLRPVVTLETSVPLWKPFDRRFVKLNKR